MASIIPILLYGLEVLILENRHLKTIDALFHRYLHGCIAVKPSFYSHVTNERVQKVSGKMPLPSQTLIGGNSNKSSRLNRPQIHCIMSFSHQDIRIGLSIPKKRQCHPRRYWFELTVERALHIYHHYLDDTAPPQFRDFRIKQLLQAYPAFESHLVAAPTRQPDLLPPPAFCNVQSGAHGSLNNPEP